MKSQNSSINLAGFSALAIGGIVATILSMYVIEKYDSDNCRTSWFARWAGIFGTMEISAFFARFLYEKSVAVSTEETKAVTSHELTGISYAILIVVFLIIILGLGWCFYRAIAAGSKDETEQHPDEIGDEPKELKW